MTMRARSKLLATAIFSSSVLLSSAPAFAQDDATSAEAKRQFVTGTKAFSSGRFQEAAQAFEAAANLKPNAVALYTAALAWEQANQNERAADDYARAVNMPGSNLQAQQATTANDRLTALEKVLGTLMVTGPDGTKVTLDQFSEAPVPARLHGTGGTHTLIVKTPGKQPDTRDVLLQGGQVQNLNVAPVAAPPKQPETQTAPQAKEVVVEKSVTHISVTKALGFSGIGAGLIGVLGAIVVGLSAQDEGDAYNNMQPTAANRQALHDAYTSANALATWSTALWIGAGVLVAAGVTLVLIPDGGGQKAATQERPADKPDQAARLTLTPSLGGLLLRGSF